MHLRYVKYKNCYGQEIIFNKVDFLCESIEISNAPARYNSHMTVGNSGQVTDNYLYSPLPIKLKCALVDPKDSIAKRHLAMDVFTPVAPGVITIINDDGIYTIEAHLTARPAFNRAGSHAWRWDADFIADFPYWQKDNENSVTLTVGTQTVKSLSPVPVPVKVKIYAAGGVYNQTINQGFNHSAPATEATYYTVDTSNFKVIDNNGNNCNNLISSADLGDLVLMPGENTILSYTAGTVLSWQELRGGVL